ncbi:hypothetical protein C1J01_47920 [Nonomuraea aridisoli]|uniref:Peptidase MA-like domain-containing protein n=1 Tax=Nonomuraea aridisoli TaxID=2070368 RepID=A0A2W2DCG9_9ACTN|nr:hypothetical protein C1J01_47920 [Nonomuraea aridisoli]
MVALVVTVATGAGVGLLLRDSTNTATPEPGATISHSLAPESVVVTDAEIDDLLTRHSEGLARGDAERFLSIFDPADKQLLQQQRRVFENLRKVPLSEAGYRILRRSGRSEDSFGRGVTFTQDVSFIHRFADIDLRPVSEWYRWTLEKKSADAPLRVTAVGGAPPPIARSSSKTVYYPGPWDIWPDITVVKAGSGIVLARPEHAALARRVAPIVEQATAHHSAYWKQYGDRQDLVPQGYLVALVSGKEQLGKLFRTAEATEAGVSIGMPNAATGADDVIVGSTRVVLDTASTFFSSDDKIGTLTRHELAHSLVSALDRSSGLSFFGGRPHWIDEGFAEYLANKHLPVRSSLRYDHGRAYLAGQLSRPFTGELPNNDIWATGDLGDAHYFMGELIMRFTADRYGDRRLVQAVTAALQQDDDDQAEPAFYDVLGVDRADFERQWAAYVRQQLT